MALAAAAATAAALSVSDSGTARCEDGARDGELVLFSGNANPELAAEIGGLLGTTLGRATVARFADGEVNCQVHDNVRGENAM